MRVRDLEIGDARAWCDSKIAAHRAVWSVLACAALYACGLMASAVHMPSALSPGGLTVGSVTYLSLAVFAVTRRAPLVPVAVSLGGSLVLMAAGISDLALAAALIVAMFAYSLRSERTPAITITGAVVMLLLAGHLLFNMHSVNGWSDVAAIPWAALAAAIGQAVRTKRAHQAMLEERARRAEQTREQEARRRVQEERLRIARELHDAVGHQVALISVQSGAMGYLLDSDLDKARESLAHIQRASEAALEELRLTVGLLRQPGDLEPTEPAGGLGRLDELIGSFTATGLEVTCDVTGPVRPLPEAVDLTAYRVVQESLTNTAKHAAGAAASVRLAFRPGVLALSVEDDGPPVHAVSPEGHGIIGMRERAAALGGWLSAGPRSDGGFRVLAELPLPGAP